MEKEFWHNKWEKNEIGFHQSAVNPLLAKHFHVWTPGTGSRIFIPLCGKTLDIAWLHSKGHKVVGVELSEIAVQQLFEELREKPAITEIGKLKKYSALDIDVFVGDIFELSQSIVGPIDAIYDRAALVALPDEMRDRYTHQLINISKSAKQLLIAFEYESLAIQGPPFSISKEIVHQYYGEAYEIELIEEQEMEGGIKGTPAQEYVWLLKS